jgi:hypothetical protein
MLPRNRRQDFGNGPFVAPIVVFVIPVADGGGQEVIPTAGSPGRAYSGAKRALAGEVCPK